MIRNILVPLGGSKFSRTALNTAINIAGAFGGNIRMLHVMDLSRIIEVLVAYKSFGGVSLDLPGVPAEDDEMHNLEEELEREKESVTKLVEDMKDRLQLPHELVIREGNVAEEILKEAQSADIIVMGKVLKKDAKDCSHLQPALVSVVHKTNKPILAVCDNEKFEGHVLIAYDGSRSSNNSLRVLGDFIPRFIKDITILTIRKTESEARPLLDEAALYFKGYEASVKTQWAHGEVTPQIIKAAQEIGASAIVMGGYGDNRLKEILVGSTTQEILKEVEIPVLLCNS